MKLQTITNEISTKHQLNYVCGRYICHKDISKPFHQLFIESTIESGLLTEPETTILENWGNSLRHLFPKKTTPSPSQATTPNTSLPNDLNTILAFVAPDGGGSQTIQRLLQTAQSTPNILQNKAWLDELFATFGIKDESVKQQLLGSGSSNQPDAVQQVKELRGTIAKQVEASQKIAEFNKQLKTEIKARQEALLKRLQELSKLQELQKQPKNTSESILQNLASILLEFPQVRQNLPSILKQMSGCDVINEQGIHKRMQNLSSNQNTMVDALIRQLIQITRTKFNEAAQSVNINPDSFPSYLRRYQESTRSFNQLNQEDRRQYTNLKNKIGQIFAKLNPGTHNPFIPTPPAPPGQKTDTEAEIAPPPRTTSVALIDFLKQKGGLGSGQRLSDKAAEQLLQRDLEPDKILILLKTKGLLTGQRVAELSDKFGIKFTS